MNGQLPPVDPDLRAQLARRVAGRAPDDLLAGVCAALDSAAAPRASLGRAWPIWRARRLLGAGIGLALVAIIAVALALPAFRPGPASTPAAYPADRALTTAELAALMAGPAMAPNTALVASVTIDSRQDVCPMNRYPTLGVIEGMGSQVCVMGSGVSDYLTEAKVSGIFAFRYLAPGYLGLLGQITPASNTKVSFAAGGDWPPQGKTFLVAGWLGAYPVSCPTVTPDQLSPGDPLNPNGADPCAASWLTDDPNAVATVAGNGLVPPAGGRFVQAGGARVIDNIDGASPVRGVYVVRGGRVLARLADLPTLNPGPFPTGAATPTPTTAPPATPIAAPTSSVAPSPAQTGLIGPGNRALTSAELAALIASDPGHLAGRYVIDERAVCDGTNGCSGSVPVTVADSIQSDGSIGLVGPLDIGPAGLVWTVPQAAARFEGRFIFILDASMFSSGQSVILDSDASAELTAQDGVFNQFAPAGTPAGSSVHGLFLVRKVSPAKTCGPNSKASFEGCRPTVEILARLEGASSPTLSPPPPAQTGLIGPGNRALTTKEVSALVAANPAGLVGRYVIDRRPSCPNVCGDAEFVYADYVAPGWTVGRGQEGELLNLAPDGIVWTLPQALASEAGNPGLYVVDAWISGAGEDSCDVVGQPCYEVSWLGSSAGTNDMAVQLGAYHEFGAGAVGGGPAIHGLFLISDFPGDGCGAAICQRQVKVLARLESVSP